jgi:hypothetical protein
MNKIFVKKNINKITSLFLIFAIFLLPFQNLLAFESSSTNFRVVDSNPQNGLQATSTNFSVTGQIGNQPFGSWASDALPLVPGTITSCGKINEPGTYTLNNDLSGISGVCFWVQSNNVTIDGAGFSVTAESGNSNYAVLATSSINGADGYGTTTIQNITFNGFGGGVNASGNINTTGTAYNISGYGGQGGDIVIATSTLGNVVSNGGMGVYGGTIGGDGGNINISNSNVGTITSNGAIFNGPSSSGGTGGEITILNSETETILSTGERNKPGGAINIYLSSVDGSILSSGGGSTSNNSVGSAVGGNILISSSTISGPVTSTGSPTIGGEGSSGGDITIINSDTGEVSSLGGEGNNKGGEGGDILISTNSIINGSVISTTAYGAYNLGRPSGLITVTDSLVLGDLITIGGDSNNSIYYTNRPGGAGGNVTVSSSTVGAILSKGGKGANNSGSGNFGGNGGVAGTITLNNSTTTSVSAIPGAAGVGLSGASNGSIGLGATTTISNSSTNDVTSAGTNGAIVITGDNLNLSNKNYSATSTLSLAYSGSLITDSTTLSALTNFIINSTNLGSYVGGVFPLIPGNINSCGTIYFPGTYTLTGHSTSNCNILNSGITIAGGGHTLTGNVTAGNYGVILSNINVTGEVSTTGATPGALTVNNASNLTGSISVTGVLNGDGSSSLGNTTINAGATVATSSVSFVGDVINNGSINSGNAVLGKTTNNSIINGDFTFNASSTNIGTVNGNAIFNASSTNIGTVNGNARFNSYTATNGAVALASTTFNGTGYVTGNVYDSANSQINSWVLNGSSTLAGILKGNAIFNNTSVNATSSIVQGNTTFNNFAKNFGTVTGNSDVYSPVVRPLGGTTNGQVIYYNYAGLYFHDSAVGHGVSGKWDDINNWWLDVSATIPSPIIPTSGDDVIILSGTLTSSSITAIARTATFQGNSNNNLNLYLSSTSTSAALFNASSTNLGTIHGNATFSGPDTENLGTVTGYITRQYNAGVYTVIRDFTQNSIHWIVQAINGASVDLSGATYSFLINTFQALNNGFFSAWNTLINGGAAGNPDLVITSPVTGTNIKWQPLVSWGTANLCQYKIGSGSYTSVICANNGSDIPRPPANVSQTVFLKSTDANGNSTEKSLSLTYDNTQPIDTDCSTPLDESSRPYYYLTNNVGNCFITASTTLRGDDGLGNFYTAGSLTGSSTNIVLENITATGTVSGFNNITVASSTLSGNLTVNGLFNSDSKSSLGNTTIQSGGSVNSGKFIGTLINNSGGVINNSTTTPVTVTLSTTNAGTINGGFIFNATSTNTGIVNGTTTLNNISTNAGTINGDLVFGNLNAINGAVTFANNTSFSGTNINNSNNVSGNIYDSSRNLITRWVFTDSSINIGSLKGKAFFHDDSMNSGKVFGDAYFSDSAVNTGTVTGNAYAYKSVGTPFTGGIINGTITYYPYPNGPSFNNISGNYDWSNLSNWFTDTTLQLPLGRTPLENEDIVLFASTTLKSNLTNNIFIAVSTTTIDGAGYTVNGNISGNGAYGGYDAYDFNLQNIIVTGTTSSIGGDGTDTVPGGNGGIINISTSSTGAIIVNGGDPQQDGGDAGSATVIYSYAIQEGTLLSAVGGDSTGCGFGGNGGNITLINSAGYILLNGPGADADVSCNGHVRVGSSGKAGNNVVQGTYTPPASQNNPVPENNTNVTTAGNSFRNIFNENVKPLIFSIIPNFTPFNSSFIPQNLGQTIIPYPFQNFRPIQDIFLSVIPSKFFDNIYKFVFSPSENTLDKYLVGAEELKQFFIKAGITNEQSLASLANNPIILKNPVMDEIPPGHFVVESLGQNVVTYITYDKTLGGLVELVKVSPNQPLTISLISLTKGRVSATYLNENLIFIGDPLATVDIVAPEKSGKYLLNTASSPIALVIEVENSLSTDNQENNQLTTIIKDLTIKISNLWDKIINNLNIQINFFKNWFNR